MSVEIAFWRFEPGVLFDGQATYEMLCDGTELEGLEDIDVGGYLARIAAAYPTATRFKDIQINHDAGDWKFQITWSKQHLVVAVYGTPGEADGDLFPRIADELGCWSYQPTSGELFGPEEGVGRTIRSRENLQASLKAALQLFKETTYEDSGLASAGGFKVGDRVSHTTFGVGTIARLEKMQADTLVVVDFDQVGRKGLALTYAPLKRL